jgi:hypothetical protein
MKNIRIESNKKKTREIKNIIKREMRNTNELD